MSRRQRQKPFFDMNEADHTPAKKKKTTDDTEDDGAEESGRSAGFINRITLKNFMCHSLLQVDFTNNVSFIIGKNGSGKSAILTALILGLGGKSSLTNRSSNVKGFIKFGQSSASINIELHNEGSMAYKPEVYGNTITVIRTISSSGSSTYKLKSVNGETISTSTRELTNIKLSLNIQIDNPVCVLNQDVSRNFLSTNNPKNMFAIFMKATRLEFLLEEYERLETNKNESVRILGEKMEQLNRLKNEITQLEAKIKDYKQISQLKDGKLLLNCELVWAKVKDFESELEEIRSRHEVAREKFNNFKLKSAKRADELKELDDANNKLKREISKLTEEIQALKQPELALRSELDELSRKISNKKREKQTVVITIQNKRRDIKSLNDNIASWKDQMSQAELEKVQKIQKLEGYKSKLKGFDDHLETIKNDLFLIRGDLSHREKEETEIRNEADRLARELNEKRNNLNAISAESTNKLLLYGRQVPRIKEMIKQYGSRFKKTPKGPLGSYVTIKDKKWTVAVEGVIGPAVLKAFIVDNVQDNKLLIEIFTKVLGPTSHPLIITSEFVGKKHDVSRNLVQEPKGCRSVYNAIDIEDPVVSNCIVDNCGPENILLVPSNDMAQQLLSERRNVPRNCYQGITENGDIYYPDPNYRTYASMYHRAQYLQVDTKEYIRELKETIENLENKHRNATQQLKTFQQDTHKKVTRQRELEEKVRSVTQARATIRNRLDELSSSTVPEAQNVRFLEEDLDKCLKTVEEKLAELETINAAIDTLEASIREKQDECSDAKNSAKQYEERVRTLNEEIRENSVKKNELCTNHDYTSRLSEELNNRAAKIEAELQIKRKEVEKYSNEASKVGNRPAYLREVNVIVNEIEKIKHKITSIEVYTENIDDLIGKHKELSLTYTNSVDFINTLDSTVNVLSEGLSRRSKHYKLTENFFTMFMKISFKKILESRQFKGDLEIDLKGKKIGLTVIPQHGSQGHSNTSNLSGGERSFSTVSFLYALWQCTDLPFYFLDEFDVYMDKLNRAKIIDILLHHAKSRPYLQFVFLTPQDVSFLGDDVTVLKLEDPRKNNNSR
ncbi:unnamed protein product [Phyllotreta striolata]|uniref:RecF/RecN/SMC N-terminal domain-containing protein n=1 Tax=Phyllotreta striolata TaxID=444603 RepID=A0A9N9TNI8_PHYSR|nr:unnamed protein product [Phyllotreta striolata]